MKKDFEMPGFRLDLSGFLDYPSATTKTTVSLTQAHERLKAKFKDRTIGFYNWPEELSLKELADIQETAVEIRSKYEAVLLVGIGGSFLGAAALMDALSDPTNANDPCVHWVSNVDRTALLRAETAVKGKRTAIVLISKSGNTTETLSALYALHSFFDKGSVYVVTDPSKGELRTLSKQFGWKSFPVPENIGGRFSVLTAVGLLPTEIAGVRTSEILEGARAMRAHLEKLAPEGNPAYRYAEAIFHWTESFQRPMHILMPYESALTTLGDWFVQLWAESIGKKRLEDQRPVGFTPIRCLGTTDQHSQLQLFKEGPADKVVGFIDVFGKKTPPLPLNPYVTEEFRFLTKHSVESINHEASLAVEKSLQRTGTPTYRFTFPDLNGETLGSFLFFQMTSCAMAGEFFGVNTFDQPGVEEAKQLLRSAL